MYIGCAANIEKPKAKKKTSSKIPVGVLV